MHILIPNWKRRGYQKSIVFCNPSDTAYSSTSGKQYLQQKSVVSICTAVVSFFLQPLLAVVIEFIQDASVFREAVSSGSARRTRARVPLVAQNQVIIDVKFWLLDIVVETISVNFAVVAYQFILAADGESSCIARSNIVFARTVLADIVREERIELRVGNDQETKNCKDEHRDGRISHCGEFCVDNNTI